jgi:sugar/nucleoside kinase (ribokinase family)
VSTGFDVMVAGHICLDVHPDLSGVERKPFEDSFLPGHVVSAGPIIFSAGGVVANTGLTLNQLGIAPCLIGKLGDDLFGQAVLRALASHGKQLIGEMVVDNTQNTSYSIIINYPYVDRIFLHYPGANDTFQASDVPYELLKQARLFHFGYPPLMQTIFAEDGVQLEEIFRRAKRTGVTTSLDMAFPDASSAAGQVNWRNILKSVLPYVDIFIPSAEEILFMIQNETYHELRRSANGEDILSQITPELLSGVGRDLIGMGARIVGLKLGYRGLYLRTACLEKFRTLGRAQPSIPETWAGKELWVPCFKVKVAGTTGSGDATIAGFLAALLHGLSIEGALRMAVAVGACNVESADALSGIRSWDVTVNRIDAGWDQYDLSLDSRNWQFDQTNGVWHGPCA